MATQLTIVNDVLLRLREDPITTISGNTYANLIAAFLNEIIQDAQSEHLWDVSRTTITFNTVSGQAEYDLSLTTWRGGAVTSGTPTNEESMLIRDSARRPLVYDTTTSGSPQLHEAEWSLLRRWSVKQQQGDSRPLYFAYSKTTSFDVDVSGTNPHGFKARLWPEPDGVYVIQADWYIPQAQLEVDGTDEDDDVEIPRNVAMLGTLWKALNERGEEIGEPGNMAETAYRRALSVSIETELDSRKELNEFEFRPD